MVSAYRKRKGNPERPPDELRENGLYRSHVVLPQ
jgi:hypothetical protein